MRKHLVLLPLCLVLAFSLLTGCGGSNGQSAATDASSAQPTAEPTPEPIQYDPLTGNSTELAGYRPVAVSVNNATGALPQWGVARAELMIEGLTEGRSSTLLCVYPDDQNLPKVGPIAPARDLTLQFVLPLNAIPVHIGSNVYASNLLNLLSYQDLNGTYVGTNAFDFDSDRDNAGYNNEFCWYTSAGLVQNGLAVYGAADQASLSAGMFHFAEEGQTVTLANGNAQHMDLVFAANGRTGFDYNEGEGRYYKTNSNGEAHMDADNGEQVSMDNVFVLYISAGVKDDGYTRDYDMTQGVGLYMTKGTWQQIVWTKGGATTALALYDMDGNPLTVNRGKSYIGVYSGIDGQWVNIQGGDGAAATLPAPPAAMEMPTPTEAPTPEPTPEQTEAPAEEAAPEGETAPEGEPAPEGEAAQG